jgi:hypothetical protein
MGNKYTSPVLAIHTWNESIQNTSMHHGRLGLTGGSGGTWLDRNKSSTQLTEAGKTEEKKTDLDADIHIIPVEDIIKVKVSTEIKKAIEQNKVVRVKTPPPEDLSCTDNVKKCCIRNVCCWCCKETKAAPVHVVSMSEKAEADRKIVVTIEYLRHSLIHTPSSVQVQAEDKQHAFYHKHLEVDSLKFYFLHNAEYDGEDYKKQLDESEALARVVMQLKAMIDQYPDPAQLQQLIFLEYSHVFGFQYTEHVPIIQGSTALHTLVRIKSAPNDD